MKLGKTVDSLYSDSVIDPTAFQLYPGSNLLAIYVIDKQSLLMEQCQTGGVRKVSAIVALRKQSRKSAEDPNY